MLQCLSTGIVSHPYVLRNNVRTSAYSDTNIKLNTTPEEALAPGEAPGDPISQLQKVAFERYTGGLDPEACYLSCVDDSYQVTELLAGPRSFETYSGNAGGPPSPGPSPFNSPAVFQSPSLSGFDECENHDYFQHPAPTTASPYGLGYACPELPTGPFEPPPLGTHSRSTSISMPESIPEQPESADGGKVRSRRKSSVSSLASSLARSYPANRARKASISESPRSRKSSISESPRQSTSSLPTTKWYREIGQRAIWTLIAVSALAVPSPA